MCVLECLQRSASQIIYCMYCKNIFVDLGKHVIYYVYYTYANAFSWSNYPEILRKLVATGA